jgi:hydrogenase maturation protein HypF
MADARLRIQVRGIVQGVGFRPFVHRIATERALRGWVFNSSSGLVTEVEGARPALDTFVEAFRNEAPPLAWIQEMQVSEIAVCGESDFVIRPSVATAGEFALISPDVAVCADCVADFSDPKNRRFGYAFTNCTNCGPRYTIIRDIPYDRPSTTMAVFPMCAECEREYHDPANRRFHAQPNACAKCGPSLSASIDEAKRRLGAGEVLAIKGLGGFHLACDARNQQAVERLRAGKRKSDKPFALMIRDIRAVRNLCVLSKGEEEALQSARSPIVILQRGSDAGLPTAVTPGNRAFMRTLGVMLPYTAMHHLLFVDAPYDALVMTSGNLSEEPIVVCNDEARTRLSKTADWFLTHNRDIYMRTDDSIVRVFEGRERVLRRSRGFAPHTLDLGRDVPELLAVGGELKNAFCLTKGRHAILSQHIGDLENYETLQFFEETLRNLKKLFRVEPRAVAHDLHPQYLSTKYALESTGLAAIGVQHHHAHIASCMAENGLTEEVIGVAFDGTGYGPDGAIWGGEFLVAGYAGYSRRAHLRYIPLAGGDTAIREPWRAALAYLIDSGATAAAIAGVDEKRQQVVRKMIATGVNTVPTSSCGRLFDAVASLIGIRNEVTFEGQAAIELEGSSQLGEERRYDFEVSGSGPWEIDFRLMIAALIRDPLALPFKAAMFHNTLAAATAEVCRRIAIESGLRRVCLSGGSFQNVRLVSATVQALRAHGLEVFLHALVPPNDGGLALGQAAIAAADNVNF